MLITSPSQNYTFTPVKSTLMFAEGINKSIAIPEAEVIWMKCFGVSKCKQTETPERVTEPPRTPAVPDAGHKPVIGHCAPTAPGLAVTARKQKAARCTTDNPPEPTFVVEWLAHGASWEG